MLARAGWAMLRPGVSSADPGDVTGRPGELGQFARATTGGRVDRVLSRIETLLIELKIPGRLSEFGVKPEQIPAIVRDSRGSSMSGNPRELSDEELTRILEAML